MDDLIKREDALKKIVGLNMQVYEGDRCVGIRTYLTKEEIIYAIDDIPPAEPERKKGKWEVHPLIGSDRPFDWWKCSECGNIIYSETERDRKEFHAFCSRCGADMREDQ